MFSCIIWTNIVHPNVYILLYFIKLHNCFSGNFPHLTLTPTFKDVLLKNYPENFRDDNDIFPYKGLLQTDFPFLPLQRPLHTFENTISTLQNSFPASDFCNTSVSKKSDKTDTRTVTCIGGTVAATFMLPCTENLKCPKHSLYRHKTMQKTVKALTMPEAKRKYLH